MEKIGDGAVVAQLIGNKISAKLCLNSLSSRCNALRASPVATLFGTAVIDTDALERDGKAFIADFAIDRDAKAALLDYLRSKYYMAPLMKGDLGHVSFSASVSLERPTNIAIFGPD